MFKLNKIGAVSLLCLMLVFISGCDDDNSQLLQENATKCARISMQQASGIAQRFAQMIKGSEGGATRGDTVTEVEVDDIFALTWGDLHPNYSRNDASFSEKDKDTVLYVANFKDNEGFAVLSANNTEYPILAVIDEGNMSKGMMHSLYHNDDVDGRHTGLKYFLELATDELEYVGGGDTYPDAPPIDAIEG